MFYQIPDEKDLFLFDDFSTMDENAFESHPDFRKSFSADLLEPSLKDDLFLSDLNSLLAVNVTSEQAHQASSYVESSKQPGHDVTMNHTSTQTSSDPTCYSDMESAVAMANPSEPFQDPLIDGTFLDFDFNSSPSVESRSPQRTMPPLEDSVAYEAWPVGEVQLDWTNNSSLFALSNHSYSERASPPNDTFPVQPEFAITASAADSSTRRTELELLVISSLGPGISDDYIINCSINDFHRLTARLKSFAHRNVLKNIRKKGAE